MKWRDSVLGVMTLVLFASVSASALDPEGLIAVFPLDEGAGDVAKDISGNGHQGTIVNGNWVDGVFGKAVEFTGGQSHMAVPGLYSSLPNNAITIGAWFQLIDHTTYEGIIGGSQPGKGDPPNDCCQYRIMVNPGSQPFFNAGNHRDVAVPGFTVKQDRWYHYVMTIGDGEVIIYMDGVPIHNDVPGSDPLPELDTDFLVATGESPGTWPMKGYIDEVFIFDRAISEAEVNDIMTLGFEMALDVSPQGKLPLQWAALKSARR